MPDLSFELALVILLALLLLLQSVRLFRLRGLPARRLARNKRRGDVGEESALALLAQAGFEILETQTMGGYSFTVDSAKMSVSLRADVIVRRDGETYLAEVKSGEESAKISTRATRRQLLEYTYAFAVDGFLLVDLPAGKIVEVKFPQPHAS